MGIEAAISVIPLFTAIFGLYFYVLTPHKKGKKVGLLSYILLSVILESAYAVYVLIRYPQELWYRGGCLLSGLSATFLFVFLYEVLNRRHLPASYLLFCLLPVATLVLTVANGFNNAGEVMIAHLIVAACLLLYAGILWRKNKGWVLEQMKSDYLPVKLLLSLLILSGMALMIPVVGRMQEPYVLLPFYLHKVIIMAIAVVFYRYCFHLYREALSGRRVQMALGDAWMSSRLAAGASSPEETLPPQSSVSSQKEETEEEVLVVEPDYYADKIARFFEEKRDYLEQDFTLQTLSDLTKIPYQQLSITFNRGMNTSFNDYLNKKRIDYALKRLAKNKDIPVTELSFSCGYKSRASFYHHFKKVTGSSVSDYKQRQR